MKSFPEGKNILITGGTGTLGSEWLFHAIKNLSNINKIVIFSRDEFKQDLMAKEFALKFPEKVSKLRKFLIS